MDMASSSPLCSGDQESGCQPDAPQYIAVKFRCADCRPTVFGKYVWSNTTSSEVRQGPLLDFFLGSQPAFPGREGDTGCRCGGAGVQVGTEWGVPQQLSGLPADGIRSVSAGARASAAVTEGGDLFIWGRLMAADNARCQSTLMPGANLRPGHVLDGLPGQLPEIEDVKERASGSLQPPAPAGGPAGVLKWRFLGALDVLPATPSCDFITSNADAHLSIRRRRGTWGAAKSWGESAPLSAAAAKAAAAAGAGRWCNRRRAFHAVPRTQRRGCGKAWAETTARSVCPTCRQSTACTWGPLTSLPLYTSITARLHRADRAARVGNLGLIIVSFD